MENSNASSQNVLSDYYSSDFINEGALEKSEEIRKEQLKKRLTIIGLGTFYVLLLVVSFTLLS